MLSTFTFGLTFATLLASVASAPLTDRKVVDIAQKRQFIDPGPFIVNCTANPDQCPTNGPSGKLNSPVANQVLGTVYDNSGYVDVSYTPVKQSVGDSGSVQTSSVIFTLREYYFGVPTYSDEVIILGQLTPPDDFSDINVRLGLPARFYDGDSDPTNDIFLSNQPGGDIGMYGFQVIEQQRYISASGVAPTTIEFQSAGPLINITYTPPPSN